MSFKIELKNSTINLKIVSELDFSASSIQFANILHSLVVLNQTLPMSSYTGARVGVTDAWNFTAVASDLREYTSTVTITAGVPKYTGVTLEQGTPSEVRAFLNAMDLFAAMLKVFEVTSVQVTWS